MVYEYIESCQPELERKAKYSKKEAKEVISILTDFGYCKETLEIPEKIITTGQLENWKKSMIVQFFTWMIFSWDRNNELLNDWQR